MDNSICHSMKRVQFSIALFLATTSFMAMGCENSETHAEDRLPPTTEYAPSDTINANNKLDSANRAIARDRDTSRVQGAQ